MFVHYVATARSHGVQHVCVTSSDGFRRNTDSRWIAGRLQKSQGHTGSLQKRVASCDRMIL